MGGNSFFTDEEYLVVCSVFLRARLSSYECTREERELKYKRVESDRLICLAFCMP